MTAIYLNFLHGFPFFWLLNGYQLRLILFIFQSLFLFLMRTFSIVRYLQIVQKFKMFHCLSVSKFVLKRTVLLHKKQIESSWLQIKNFRPKVLRANKFTEHSRLHDNYLIIFFGYLKFLHFWKLVNRFEQRDLVMCLPQKVPTLLILIFVLNVCQMKQR